MHTPKQMYEMWQRLNVSRKGGVVDRTRRFPLKNRTDQHLISPLSLPYGSPHHAVCIYLTRLSLFAIARRSTNPTIKSSSEASSSAA